MHPATGITLILLIGGSFVAWREHSIGEQRRGEKVKLQTEIGRLEERRSTLEQEEAERADLINRRKANSIATIKSSGADERARLEVLQREAARLEEEYVILRKEMSAAVQLARMAAAKAAPVDITLPGGAVLKDCRIKGVDDGVVSVEHTAGLHRLALAETPAEWVEQFALTWTLKPVEPDDKEPSIAVAPAVPVATRTPAVASAAAPTSALDFEIRRRREAVSSWLQRYATAWRAAEYHSRQASSAAWSHYVARMRGNISAHTAVAQSHSSKARAAQAIADESLIRIEQLRAEISDLMRRQSASK